MRSRCEVTKFELLTGANTTSVPRANVYVVFFFGKATN
jgi:hypothetical protein